MFWEDRTETNTYNSLDHSRAAYHFFRKLTDFVPATFDFKSVNSVPWFFILHPVFSKILLQGLIYSLIRPLRYIVYYDCLVWYHLKRWVKFYSPKWCSVTCFQTSIHASITMKCYFPCLIIIIINCMWDFCRCL